MGGEGERSEAHSCPLSGGPDPHSAPLVLVLVPSPWTTTRLGRLWISWYPWPADIGPLTVHAAGDVGGEDQRNVGRY
ncbi:hypothetical protein NHX12_000817 [Muraenolepis orangiensis]|uniref:Uncharacterized protein n=1 Tax=Muraenolepis orangiensis TaxID=630683 RepID=A0A9Q0DX55_9TELE|nr:hypothetical protein NHX12_000817 [Muraenolepis orangiensis]